MKNFRLLIEFDGTNFSGWQYQPETRTVQGVLEEALGQIVGGDRPSVVGAGRTDAGVHARGMVAHAKLETTLLAAQILPAINSRLDRDLRVRQVEEVGTDFHARFDATGREYSYTMDASAPVLGRQYVWAYERELPLDRLNDCAAMLMGEHDFAPFAKANLEVDSTNCTVTTSQWVQEGSRLIFRIAANRFLHHMVRFLTGTLVEVARGRFTRADFEAHLAGAGALAPFCAPAQGLILEKVIYDKPSSAEEVR